jgi:ABC-type lipoprotein export system ATPase subunit
MQPSSRTRSANAAPVPLLSISDVHVRSKRSPLREVLRGASLTVAPGEIVAVVNSSRAEWAALLDVASGLRAPDSGRVALGGFEFSTLSERERDRKLRGKIGLAWFDLTFAPRTVVDYVAVAAVARNGVSLRQSKRSATEALDRFGLTGHQRQLDELSRWERLLVELSRFSIIQPELMLFDELFYGLGQRAREVGASLRALLAELGCGALMNVTDVASARIADVIWRLDRGVAVRVFDGENNLVLAREIYERGFTDAAAMIAGIALEEHLRALASVCEIAIEGSDGTAKADSVNNALVREGAYGRLQHKYVTAWLDLRNKAVHGRCSEYDDANVIGLLDGVSTFIVQYPLT